VQPNQPQDFTVSVLYIDADFVLVINVTIVTKNSQSQKLNQKITCRPLV